MNNPLDPTLRELNDCGACAGTGAETPAVIANRPGLPAVSFRAGVHSQFKATQLAALSSQAFPALRDLRTRAEDDFTIALLDAFASTADVLTFYSERIANEAYLRTATERRSVLELARAIGYELAPGVAAQVMLAFTVEGGAGAPGTTIIPKGTKLQSIPGPGEKPQVFETSVDFTGRAAWNEFRPRLREVPLQGAALLTVDVLFLDGVATNLKPGDVLVLADGATPGARARRIATVTVDRERAHTQVTLEADTAPASSGGAPAIVAARAAAAPEGVAVSSAKPLPGTIGEMIGGTNVSAHEIQMQVSLFGFDAGAAQKSINSRPKVTLSTPQNGVFALRKRVGFFGHNAPKWKSLPKTDATRDDPYTEDWDDLGANPRPAPAHTAAPTTIWQDSQGVSLAGATGFDVFLERAVPEVIKDGWLALETAGERLLPLRVGSASEVSRADYAMSAKANGLQLQTVGGSPLATKDEAFKNRSTTAHVHSEALNVIGAPIETNLTQGQTILELDRIDIDLAIGQSLALQGENADLPGTTLHEIISIAAIIHTDVTTLTLAAGLQHNYLRATVTLNANVVAATHGETSTEVLGGGDASLRFQQFVLKQKPLTYTFPPGGAVNESSLEIWVDEVRWTEAPTFFGHGPKERIYVVRRADDGTVTVQFGDGLRGARLPTGRENIRAVYRHGIGMEGLVQGDQIKLLLTQPLGVKGVTNPLAPQGAEDPQSLDDARENAPRTVLTLDRVVSLQDYQDFARDFPGVAKAHAAWIWSGQTRGVLLTLLGPDGLVIGDTGQPADPLRGALAGQGIPRVPVRIVSRRPSLFQVAGTVRTDPDRVPSVVEAGVLAALRDAFSFEAREFGQGVALSEVIAVIQNVPGVAFVDVDTGSFKKTAYDPSGTPLSSVAENDYLAAHKPADGAGASLAEPAELLILDEASLPQLEVKSA